MAGSFLKIIGKQQEKAKTKIPTHRVVHSLTLYGYQNRGRPILDDYEEKGR